MHGLLTIQGNDGHFYLVRPPPLHIYTIGDNPQARPEEPSRVYYTFVQIGSFSVKCCSENDKRTTNVDLSWGIRIPPDPNRVPKYHDERLPAGKSYFGMIFQKFGVKIYYYLLFYLANSEKNLFWTKKKFVYLLP